jgi:hypothetical protein
LNEETFRKKTKIRMKQTQILLIILLIFQTNFSFSQTESTDVSGVLEALNQGTDNVAGLDSILLNWKTTMTKEFNDEQKAIDNERRRLDIIKQELDKDNHREAQMMYDEWVARSQANTKLMQGRERLHERELALEMSKMTFGNQLKQAEQKLLSTVANELQEQLNYHNQQMESLKKQLADIEKLKKLAADKVGN